MGGRDRLADQRADVRPAALRDPVRGRGDGGEPRRELPRLGGDVGERQSEHARAGVEGREQILPAPPVDGPIGLDGVEDLFKSSAS
jgi:hypothetical protein